VITHVIQPDDSTNFINEIQAAVEQTRVTAARRPPH
jgi:hypothetical protein